jgi:hypothetical protein
MASFSSGVDTSARSEFGGETLRAGAVGFLGLFRQIRSRTSLL